MPTTRLETAKNVFKISRILGLLLLALFFASPVYACDIEFEILGDTKDVYNVGDELVVMLVVKFTDRECPEGIEATQYKTEGLKIAAATKWKETSPDIWKRKLKVVVEEAKDGTPKLAAIRTCDKEGGFGELSCAAAQLEISANIPKQSDKN